MSNFGIEKQITKVQPQQRKIPRKINQVEYSKRHYKVPKNNRYQNKLKLNVAQYKMKGIQNKDNQNSLKRKFRKVGVDPQDLVVYKNPITHQNNGNGYFYVNKESNHEKTKMVKNLKKIGINVKPVKNFVEKMK